MLVLKSNRRTMEMSLRSALLMAGGEQPGSQQEVPGRPFVGLAGAEYLKSLSES